MRLHIFLLCLLGQTSAGEIYWSDGDSGRINGEPFRLANVDAPETGGVGAAIGGAKCERERELGFDAKAFVVEITQNSNVEIINSYGNDRHGRKVVDITADGVDIGQAGVQAGHLRPWPHRSGRPVTQKPDWCGLPFEK